MPAFIDITGQRFGRLIVISHSHTKITSFWNCLCDCGKAIVVRKSNLKSGTTQSCGCLHTEVIRKIRVNHSGLRMGKLLIGEYDKRVGRNYYWKYKCDCGKEGVISSAGILNGGTVSCGCYGRQARIDSITTHGLSKIPEYQIWGGIIQRCTNPNNTAYKYYGAKGKRICKAWRESFQNFYDDVGNRPSPELSIDRINNDLHYSCGHCDECTTNGWKANWRWGTDEQQMQNRGEYNRWIEWGGKNMLLCQWAKQLKIGNNKLHSFLRKHSMGEAILKYK